MPSLACLVLLVGADATWHQMPNGLYFHEDCIHRHDDDFHLRRSEDGGSVLSFAGQRETVSLPPCEHAPRATPPAVSSNVSLGVGADVSYYSGWSHYAKAARPEGFGYMSNAWKVPSEPKSRGPASQSSLYLFNGLEDGGGKTGASTLILQPVLTYGKSGCIIDPLKWGKWWLISFVVSGGRAHCGARLGPLKEGEDLVGEMTLTNPDDNTWRVDSTRVKTGKVSTYSTTLNDLVLDAAYLTAEGMIIYSCGAFPDTGNCTFTDNKLSDRAGNSVSPKWEKVVAHSECSQEVQLPKSATDAITLTWDATAKFDSALV